MDLLNTTSKQLAMQSTAREHEPLDSEVLTEVSRLRNENPEAGIKTLYRLIREAKPDWKLNAKVFRRIVVGSSGNKSAATRDCDMDDEYVLIDSAELIEREDTEFVVVKYGVTAGGV